MIGCLRTRSRKQPIIALYFEFGVYSNFIISGPDVASATCLRDYVLPNGQYAIINTNGGHGESFQG